MSPKRVPGSSLSWVILITLWAAIAAAPAKAQPGRSSTSPAVHQAATAPSYPSHSLSSFRRSIARFVHRFHYRHHVRVAPPGSRALSLPSRLRPADEDQAIPSGPLPCWQEPTAGEPPAPVALALPSNRPPAECGEYSERRTPRGPPFLS